MPSGWDKAPEYGGPKRPWWGEALGIVAAIVFSLALATCAVQSARGQGVAIVGVASAIDGDTIEIHGQRIRLSGFDTPESGSMCGQVNVYQRASLALADFIGVRTVSCAVSERDRYGRAVARCNVGGTDLGEHMVANGWARDWPRYSGGQYADEEARARIEHRGIWGMQCPASLWGNRDYSQSSSSLSVAPAVERSVAYVSASTLNLRSGPGPQHPVIGRLAHGSRVEMHEQGEEWARVAASDLSGWVSSSHLSATEPPAPAQPTLSDARIRQMIIQRSIAGYSGSCPCPYNVDRGGRRCGGRSAYSRPGGASPVCYPADVSDSQVRAFRARR